MAAYNASLRNSRDSNGRICRLSMFQAYYCVVQKFLCSKEISETLCIEDTNLPPQQFSRRTTIPVLILLHMCPHITICVLILLHVSSYYHICVLILLYMCPHSTIYVSSYYYICVLILVCMCPHMAHFFFLQAEVG